jgi:hypothetical protein
MTSTAAAAEHWESWSNTARFGVCVSSIGAIGKYYSCSGEIHHKRHCIPEISSRRITYAGIVSNRTTCIHVASSPDFHGNHHFKKDMKDASRQKNILNTKQYCNDEIMNQEIWE